jgi:hypothetical protein
MEADPKSSEDDRQRLESITQSYAAYQGLGVSIAGVLALSYGWIRLAGGFDEHHGWWLLAMQLVLWSNILLPRLFSRFYYRPKFGYVKPLSPQITDRQFWAVSAGAVVFGVILVPFVILPAWEHSDRLPFEPFTLAIGVALVGSGLFNLNKPNYKPYFLVFGLALLTLAFLPTFHIQTHKQVLSSWFWVAVGVFDIVFGWDSHRTLVRNLAISDREQNHV